MRRYFLLLAALLAAGCTETAADEAANCTCAGAQKQVCGLDNATYGSECEANCSNTSVAYEGACQTCQDSDGGNDPLIKGVTSVFGTNYTDYCVVFWSVEEYYCKGDVAGRETVSCEEGYECRDGACVEKPIAPPKPDCDDPDGDDIYTKGTVNAAGQQYVDSCDDYKTVREYLCKNGLAQGVSNDCPAGYTCGNGRCSKPDVLCNDTDYGRNISAGGKVLVVSGLVSAEYIDKCVDWNTVKEYYCDKDGYVGETIDCPQGQKCVEASCNEDLCTDSDEGYSIFHGGAVNKGSSIYRDACTGAEEGIEYYCDDNLVINSTFTCPSGSVCNNGRCEG